MVLGVGLARRARALRRRGAGHAGGTLGALAGRWARGRARGRAAGFAGGRRADGRQRRAGRAQQGRGRRAAWALGARPGRAGWPWAVHSVHSAHFQSVLTRFFFPESLNEHCSL